MQHFSSEKFISRVACFVCAYAVECCERDVSCRPLFFYFTSSSRELKLQVCEIYAVQWHSEESCIKIYVILLRRLTQTVQCYRFSVGGWCVGLSSFGLGQQIKNLNPGRHMYAA